MNQLDFMKMNRKDSRILKQNKWLETVIKNIPKPI